MLAQAHNLAADDIVFGPHELGQGRLAYGVGIFARQDGAWQVAEVYARHDGDWKAVIEAWRRQGGEWLTIYQA